VRCSGSIVNKTFDAIRELRDAGIVVVVGFHSPMKKECLNFLLRGEQPVIVCPPKWAVNILDPVRQAGPVPFSLNRRFASGGRPAVWFPVRASRWSCGG
jgi:hypothetical protein